MPFFYFILWKLILHLYITFIRLRQYLFLLSFLRIVCFLTWFSYLFSPRVFDLDREVGRSLPIIVFWSLSSVAFNPIIIVILSLIFITIGRSRSLLQMRHLWNLGIKWHTHHFILIIRRRGHELARMIRIHMLLHLEYLQWLLSY